MKESDACALATAVLFVQLQASMKNSKEALRYRSGRYAEDAMK